MGCNCRKNAAAHRTVVSKGGVARGAQQSPCSDIERSADRLSVIVRVDGLYIAPPYGSDSLNVAMLLSSWNCTGSVAGTLRSLHAELMSMSREKRAEFIGGLPYHTVKLGYLKELLKSTK